MKTIYKAKHLLTMSGEIVENGWITMQDGVIAAIGSGTPDLCEGDIIHDLGDAAILPGFVNAHSHIDYTMTRSSVDGLNLWDWLNAVGFRKGRVPDYDLIALSAKLGAAQCALSGITCLGDSTFSGAAIDAMDEAGLRGIAYQEIFGQSMGDKYVEEYARKLDNILARSAPSSNVKIGISPHTLYTTNQEVLKLCAKSLTELNIPVALHLAETSAEAQYCVDGTGPLADWRRSMGYEPMRSHKRPLATLQEAGLLRKRVCLAHCVDLNDSEIEVLSKSGATVAHCARSNAYLGAGTAPVVSMRQRGISVGIGTDSAASCMNLDFFEEMRFALAIHRAVAKDAGVISAKSILEMATIGGARALGLDQEIGTLEVGKRADIIAINMKNALPGEEIHLSIINRSPSDVALVVVDGTEIACDGRLAAVDIEDVKMELRARIENR